MIPAGHIIASGISGSLFGLWTKSPLAAFVCFIGGIFMDIDHFLDYVVTHKKVCDYKELKRYCLNDRAGNMYQIFHAYELLALLWAIIYFWQLDYLWIGFVIGMSIHLLLDQLINDIYPLTYFGLYRCSQGFRKSLFHKDNSSVNL